MVCTYQVVSSYIGSESEVFIMFCDIVISKSINVSHSTLTHPIPPGMHVHKRMVSLLYHSF